MSHTLRVQLYAVSVNRRDDQIVVKKKIPGGPSNGGTYYTISNTVAYTVPYGSWQSFRATIQTLVNGSVEIALYQSGVLLLSVIDDGSIGGPPITQAGSIGVRGDNCNLEIGRIIATSL